MSQTTYTTYAGCNVLTRISKNQVNRESLRIQPHASFCFNQLQLNRLEADIDPENRASAALLIKCGFQLEGLLKERWIVNGKITDSEIYGLVGARNNKVFLG